MGRRLRRMPSQSPEITCSFAELGAVFALNVRRPIYPVCSETRASSRACSMREYFSSWGGGAAENLGFCAIVHDGVSAALGSRERNILQADFPVVSGSRRVDRRDSARFSVAGLGCDDLVFRGLGGETGLDCGEYSKKFANLLFDGA